MPTFFKDHFLLEDLPLHTGTISKIYRATDYRVKETVVVKMLSYLGPLGRDAMEMWTREARALTELVHPTIVKLIEYFDDDQNLCLILDYVPNQGTLADFINGVQSKKKNPPPLHWRFKQAILLLEAINFVHEHGIIHRDINPNNVLVSDGPEPNLVLIDFGISKIINTLTKDPHSLPHWYTPPYAAPERLYENQSSYEGDYFLFGLTALSLLTMQPLTKQVTPEDVPDYFTALAEDFQDPHTLTQVQELIAALVATEPGLRPRPTEALVILERALERVRTKPTVYLTFTGNATKKLQLEHINRSNFLANLSRGKMLDEESILLIGKSMKAILREHEGAAPYCWTIVDAFRERQVVIDKLRGKTHPLPYKFQEGSEPAEEFSNHLHGLFKEEQRRLAGEEARRKRFATAAFMLKRLESWDRTVQVLYENPSTPQTSRRKNGRVGKTFRVGANQVYTLEVRDLLFERYTGQEGDITEFFQEMTQHQGVMFYHEEKMVGEFRAYNAETQQLTLVTETQISLPTHGHLRSFNIASRVATRRQQKALDDFVAGRSASDRLALQLLEPRFARTSKEMLIQLLQSLEPSDEMRDLVERIINVDSLFTLQGPPGTGKTTVIAETVAQLLKKNPQANILVTSQANQAVDNALERIAELREEQRGPWHIVRDSSDKRTQGQKQSIHFEPTFQRFSERTVQYSLEAEAKVANTFEADVRKAVHDVLEEWRNKLAGAMELKDAFFSTVQVHGATCLRVPEIQKRRHYQPFDWVIVDEAAKTLDAEVLIPLVHGRKILLVGDQAQLKPHVDFRLEAALKEKGILDYEVSLFERLFDAIPPSNRAALTTQFRMHHSIGDFISTLFYQNLPEGLKTGVRDELREIVVPSFQGNNRVFWHDIRGQEKKQGRSFLNDAETREAFNVLKAINTSAGEHGVSYSVSVITPYNAQVKALRFVAHHNQLNNIQIEVATVDSFQGRQTDITLYSLVRTSRWGLRFPARTDRLNVAFSRAKLALIIIGDYKNAGNDPILARARDLAVVRQGGLNGTP
jgi:serine/threonine protein kinase